MRSVWIVAMAMLLILPVLTGQTGRSRGRRSTTPTTSTGTYKGPEGTFHGILKQISGKEIVIAVEGDQTMSVRRTRKTKFMDGGREVKPAAFVRDTPISIEFTQDIDMKPLALTVRIDTPTAPAASK